jgi:hypothetical protein
MFYFSFRLRIECMLLKAEFEANLSFLEPSIESMLAAGQGKSYPRIFMKDINREFRLPVVKILFHNQTSPPTHITG